MAAVKENVWPRRIDLAEREYIMMHNTNVIVHFCSSTEQVDWSGEDSVTRPKVVRRGTTDIEDEIEDGMSSSVKDWTLLCVGCLLCWVVVVCCCCCCLLSLLLLFIVLCWVVLAKSM